MAYKRRDCGIKMTLVPYGGGWTDLYADFGDGEHYFIISNVIGDGFQILVKALFLLSPENNDCLGNGDGLIRYKYGIYEEVDGKEVLTEIVDDCNDIKESNADIPWKASFIWDEEGAYSEWTMEREPNDDPDFTVKITIEHCVEQTEHYEYNVKYKDICYAVSDACTRALKKHGFTGYNAATYTEDWNVRYLLALKATALQDKEACKLTYYREKGKGETSDFSKELELLLFDM